MGPGWEVGVRLLSIGAFARATRLTPKALRLYDELGLLPPAFVDPVSGYRFYDPAQLGRARVRPAHHGNLARADRRGRPPDGVSPLARRGPPSRGPQDVAGQLHLPKVLGDFLEHVQQRVAL